MTGPQLAKLQEVTDQMMWQVADAEQQRHFQLKHSGSGQGSATQGVKAEPAPSEAELNDAASSHQNSESQMGVKTGE